MNREEMYQRARTAEFAKWCTPDGQTWWFAEATSPDDADYVMAELAKQTGGEWKLVRSDSSYTYHRVYEWDRGNWSVEWNSDTEQCILLDYKKLMAT